MHLPESCDSTAEKSRNAGATVAQLTRARFKTPAFELFYCDNFDLNSLNNTVGLFFNYPPTQQQQTNSLSAHKSTTAFEDIERVQLIPLQRHDQA